MSNTAFNSLQGQFLIAMPNLEASFFDHALIYMLEHNNEGAMGLIINQTLDIDVDELLEQVDGSYQQHYHPQQVLCGGPVETGRGFVLHHTRPDKHWLGEMPLDNGISVTASADILNAMMRNEVIGPCLLVLGYAGWGPGQLEQELLDNAWLTIPANPEVMFTLPAEQRLEHVMRELGISYQQLTHNTTGHA